MRKMYRHALTHGFPLLVISLVILSGCGGVLITPYGNIATDGDETDITMPAEAPTIFHGYYTRTEGSLAATSLGSHEAIDIYAEEGAPVLAPAAGTVAYSDFEIMIGNTIIIEHGEDSSGRVLMTKYQHLQKSLVQEGDIVARGQQIGTLGMTGALSAAIPHLHFETRTKTAESIFTDTDPINPHLLWIGGIGIVSCYDNNQLYPDSPIRLTYPAVCRGIPWR